jgi:pantothenate kinase
MNSLIKLIGIEKDLNSAFEEAYVSGESKNVDLSVGDIYGSGSNVNFSLPKDLLASSMGKAQFEDHTVFH